LVSVIVGSAVLLAFTSIRAYYEYRAEAFWRDPYGTVEKETRKATEDLRHKMEKKWREEERKR
jgi:hypothetical protein